MACDSSDSALAALAAAKYVSFTTFRRSGEPVSTPVWIARDGDELVFVSAHSAGKSKRLAHTSAVELRVCDIRGTVEDGAQVYAGTAQVLRSKADLVAARRAVGRKYFSARLMNVVAGVASKFGRTSPGVAIRIAVR